MFKRFSIIAACFLFSLSAIAQEAPKTTFDYLPTELITKIFSYCPEKDVLRLSRVSHFWNEVANHVFRTLFNKRYQIMTTTPLMIELSATDVLSFKILPRLKNAETPELKKLFQFLHNYPEQDVFEFTYKAPYPVVKINPLPEALYNLRASIIKLSGQCLDTISGRISWENVSDLDLSHNQLTQFPIAITKCRNLTKLDVSCNKITGPIPESIKQLHKLEVLDFHNNQIKSLPESLGELTRLTKIDGNINKLEALPDSLVRLTKLRELSLAHNQLEGLPKTVVRTALRSRGSFFLKGQEDMDELERVHYIYPLPFLRKLDLSHNKFQRFSEQLLSLPNIENLNLQNNLIQDMPALKEPMALKSLKLEHNQLSKLPNLFGCYQLTNLDLSYNQIAYPSSNGASAAQPVLTASLEQLNLEGNQLKDLPKMLKACTKLHTLNISENTTLTILPPVISELPSLQVLDFHSSRVEKLPDNLSKLTQLKTLNAAGNDLKSLANDFTGTIYPDKLGWAASIPNLNLSGNKDLGLSFLQRPLQNLSYRTYYKECFIGGIAAIGLGTGLYYAYKKYRACGAAGQTPKQDLKDHINLSKPMAGSQNAAAILTVESL